MARTEGGPGRVTKPEPAPALTAAEILEAKKPVRHTVPICLDSDLADEVTRAEFDVNTLERKLNLRPNDDQLMIDLEAARIRLEEATLLKDVHSVPFKFRALGGTRLEELQALHPPTEKQTKEFKAQLKAASMPQNAQLPYNSDTYPPALIAAACIEPTFTLEQAQELWTSENWSQGERIVIFQAAISVNNQVK